MPPARINLTLGTAGHIDHGKTALVKSLTGCETDRLKAEKERGMSIDLGFAPCAIAGSQVGIVDVPGHENFVKTMVAGASGMDGVILVVAADDGVMPQTREHLDILTLLGVQHGMVALTKIDRVESDHLELAQAELDDFLQGTFLEAAPICPVSSTTGEGFDRFYEALETLVRAVEPRQIDGVFRLPLDRAFSVKGHGTVLSGIPVSGSARVGDEVALLPRGLTGTIRGIEVYGDPTDTVLAGQCAALNVRHWDSQSIRRGDTLATPACFTPQQWYVCALRLLGHKKLVLKNGANLKFHTGTTEVAATVYLFQGNHLQAGESQLVQVRVKAPIVAGPGDHFILRSLSPIQTIGGGMIVEGVSRRVKRNRPDLHDDLRERARAVAHDASFVEYCTRKAESLATTRADLAFRAKVPPHRVDEILAKLTDQGKILPLGPNLCMHSDTAREAGDRVLERVRDFHRQSPESPGISPTQLRETCQLQKPVLDGLLSLLKKSGRLVERNGRLAAADHQVTFREEDARTIESIEAVFREQAFRPPGVEELVEKTGATTDAVKRALRILREHERLVQVAEGLLFHCEAVDRGQEILVEFLRQEGRLESVRFKYLLDTTRKFTIPLLDYFDKVGVTRRSGNTRYLKTPVTNDPGP